jgi:SpoVK/Ycf46/Vps4 family AAA+-type ATPase
MSKFRFHTVSNYAATIRIYSYHLSRSNPDLASDSTFTPIYLSTRETDGVVEVLLGMPDGHYEFAYKTHAMAIKTDESPIFKGTGSGSLQKWIDVYVYVEAATREDAEQIFTEFVNDAIKFTKKKEETKVSIQIYDVGYGWRQISNLPRRPIDTIYLDPVEKKKLVDDVVRFTKEEAEYIEYGIPYKRCYLFQGTPGSGKTSLIFALASMLKKDISIFNFSAEVTDVTFISAISQLSTDRILLLEDLDSLFVDRNQVGTNHVSFSALQNVLDGVCRKDKMITFITTNHIKRLDPALLRPGRVDYMMEFTFATRKQVKQMYDKFLPSQPHNFDTFYELVRGKKINMSLVQKFLFEHRRDPDILQFERELSKLIIEHEEKDAMGTA